MIIKSKLLVLAAIIGCISVPASATVMHLGGTFYVEALSYSGNTGTFQYNASMDGFTGRDYIASIDFGISGNHVTSSSLLDTNAAGTWSSGETGPTNASGGGQCQGTSDVFVCSDDIIDGIDQATAGNIWWKFKVTFEDAITAESLRNGGHIGAFFCGINSANDRLNCGDGLSQSSPIGVPEPGTLSLLGAGLLGLGLMKRKRKA